MVTKSLEKVKEGTEGGMMSGGKGEGGKGRKGGRCAVKPFVQK
jgi:hypothetical protein